MNISRTTSTSRLLAAALALTFLTASAFGATVLTINTTNDTGAGSLRDTIVRLNDVCAAGDAQCKVTIDLPQYSSFAPHTPLPPITACGSIEIDGGREAIEDDRLFELSGRNLTFGSGLNVRPDCSDGLRKLTISGLVINSFPQDGISIHPTGGQYEVVLSGLFIGTDVTGREARANAWRGVAVTSPLATVRVETSIVSGNGRSGVWGWDSAYVSVRATKLGVGADGRPLGNGATGFALLRGRGDIRESVVAHNAHWGMSAVPGAYLNSSYRNSI
ncbi:MAG TPA: hypothetical protein VE010_15420, partial [Thermoanaerobaculia bacterium]|nr:hypothetical protein [Thermoanaerobaculia bacterium]